MIENIATTAAKYMVKWAAFNNSAKKQTLNAWIQYSNVDDKKKYFYLCTKKKVGTEMAMYLFAVMQFRIFLIFR